MLLTPLLSAENANICIDSHMSHKKQYGLDMWLSSPSNISIQSIDFWLPEMNMAIHIGKVTRETRYCQHLSDATSDPSKIATFKFTDRGALEIRGPWAVGVWEDGDKSLRPEETREHDPFKDQANPPSQRNRGTLCNKSTYKFYGGMSIMCSDGQLFSSKYPGSAELKDNYKEDNLWRSAISQNMHMHEVPTCILISYLSQVFWPWEMLNCLSRQAKQLWA